jgi:hypothetical protein
MSVKASFFIMSFKEWFEEHLKDNASDIANHGIDGGFSGVIYTSECVELFDKYDKEIWDLAVEQAEEYGCNVLELILTFRRKDMVEDINQFKNLMVWFACETLAMEFCNE